MIPSGLVALFLLATSSLAAPAAPPAKWCAYLADWGKEKETETLQANLKQIDTLWMRMFTVLPDGHLDLKWEPKGTIDAALKALAKSKHAPHFGPLLQNTGGGGFSRPLGILILQNTDLWLKDLFELKKKWKFTSFQLDIESMDPLDATLYEESVRKIAQFAEKNGIAFSIALHAQTESPSRNTSARFQRWEVLGKISARKVIMGFDYSWPQSPPGQIAPINWLLDIARFAQTFFSKKELVIALPLYGYHWRKGQDAESVLSEEMKSFVQREPDWKQDKSVVKDDGYFYQKSTEAIAFDDTPSVLEKRAKLIHVGITAFAFWRVGGETANLYR